MQRTPEQQHDLDWSEPLQDWLDGDLDAEALARFEAHLEGCAVCQERVAQFKELDAALEAAVPRLALDASFDERLFAKLDEADEAKRAEARRRAQQEFERGMSALARKWRLALGLVIPGAIAGIALAFAVTAWLGDSGLTYTLAAEGSERLGMSYFELLRIGLTAIVGAVLGGVVARWLTTVAD
ncbi:MAG TPA: zf-HC2 domain-containing protein [Steroidobacteraceae bacterium]|jgi:anti-sigma factor RsiW